MGASKSSIRAKSFLSSHAVACHCSFSQLPPTGINVFVRWARVQRESVDKRRGAANQTRDDSDGAWQRQASRIPRPNAIPVLSIARAYYSPLLGQPW